MNEHLTIVFALGIWIDNIDPDQTQKKASGHGLYCLPLIEQFYVS